MTKRIHSAGAEPKKMGRKSNPVLVEYFHRGHKLTNNSNRYHHTCKLCGEEFPRGRVEGLSGHITKKCPAISLAERTSVVLRLHDLEKQDGGVNTEVVAHTTNRGQANLSYTPPESQQFNALNVLAEASRRVGAPNRGRKSQALKSDLPLDPALIQPADQNDENNLDDSYIAYHSPVPGLPDLSATALPDDFDSVPTNLTSIAASAQHLADVGASNSLDGTFERRPLTILAESSNSNHSQVLNDPQRSSQRLLAANPVDRPLHITNQSVTDNKVQKPKVRGKFEDGRRQQVQQIRQQGACLRCRKLKKSCSEGTPCTTCESVENARLWKGPCVRPKAAADVSALSIE